MADDVLDSNRVGDARLHVLVRFQVDLLAFRVLEHFLHL